MPRILFAIFSCHQTRQQSQRPRESRLSSNASAVSEAERIEAVIKQKNAFWNTCYSGIIKTDVKVVSHNNSYLKRHKSTEIGGIRYCYAKNTKGYKKTGLKCFVSKSLRLYAVTGLKIKRACKYPNRRRVYTGISRSSRFRHDQRPPVSAAGFALLWEVIGRESRLRCSSVKSVLISSKSRVKCCLGRGCSSASRSSQALQQRQGKRTTSRCRR